MPVSPRHGKLPETPTTMTSIRSKLLILILPGLLMLAGCSGNFLHFPGVYRIDILQGNIITQDMVDQLRPGMTKRQVIFVMGTPMVADPFHQDRWDYVYNYQPGGGVRVGEKLTVFFSNDQLVQITGDFTPSNAETATALTQP